MQWIGLGDSGRRWYDLGVETKSYPLGRKLASDSKRHTPVRSPEMIKSIRVDCDSIPNSLNFGCNYHVNAVSLSITSIRSRE
ncbi:hypothetical protein V1477_004254 [Vespula maculifrons]|uniref:Uncharacterized protein n=1 Tax=Vespula maculifrons TaxID=7453 RepID=A0ABD2CR47_VESMC